jgi:hypothetical protein
MRRLALASLFPLFPLFPLFTACTAEPKQPLDAALAGDLDGKADAGSLVEGQALRPGEAVSGSVGAGGQVRHALELDGAARLSFEITRDGTSEGLDTTLHLFGPVGADGKVPALARALDDDSGDGNLSHLTEVSLEAGRWLVVVGVFDGTRGGDYRLEVGCASGDCGTGEPACPAEAPAAISACVEGVEEGSPIGDDDGPTYDPYATRDWDLHLACAKAEVGVEVATGCALSTWGASREGACAFGTRYADLGGRAEAVVVVGREVIETADGLDSLAQKQLVAAVGLTAYEDVRTAAEALEAVDEGRANRTTLWDASNGAAYVAWEVGAGDNSFGAIFAYEGTEPVATIVDGDFDRCDVSWGPMRRKCSADADCGAGLACLGVSAADGLGLCADVGDGSLPEGAGVQCAPWLEGFGCPAASGLLCGSASADHAGVCVEAHHRVVSGPVANVPVNANAETVLSFGVHGVGPATAGVRLKLVLVHGRLGDVKVVLAGPDGRSATVFDGSIASFDTSRGELYLDGFGDKALVGGAAVGTWQLRILDGGRGDGGSVYEAALEVTAKP